MNVYKHKLGHNAYGLYNVYGLIHKNLYILEYQVYAERGIPLQPLKKFLEYEYDYFVYFVRNFMVKPWSCIILYLQKR